ncbi:MAG: helix-turn-helix domain-containing protein, partial [Pseudoclavibacter sp.]
PDRRRVAVGMTIADSPPLAVAAREAGAAGHGATALTRSMDAGEASASPSPDARALERILGALEWRVTATRTLEPSLEGSARFAGERPVMLYVTSGSVRMRQPVGAMPDRSTRSGAASEASIRDVAGRVGDGLARPGSTVRAPVPLAQRVADAPSSVACPSSDDAETCSREFGTGDLALSITGCPFELVADDPAAHVIVSELAFTGAESFALNALPSMLVVRNFVSHEPAIAGLAAVMGDGCGVARSRIADSIVCAHIATTVIAAAVRTWSELGCAPGDWLARTDDPHLVRVLDAIHGDPGHAWTVGELATLGAMSRSVFAERFRELVGASPASYLASVRMSRAMAMFKGEALSVSAVAHQLGYESEAGFSRAFRRHTGQPPAAWRQRALAG